MNVKTRVEEYFRGNKLAISVWETKYKLNEEDTPDLMHRRMSKEFARIEELYRKIKKPDHFGDLSRYGRERDHLTEEGIYQLFKDFKHIIPQGSVMTSLGSENTNSLSNCFVIGQPEDSYGGILQKDEEMAQLMKKRGGVGIDLSKLRPTGTLTNNSSKTSTGAVSFMHRYSNTTREVAQNGRRGALMISMDINHPDILEFIKIKRDLTQVTGANISIKLNDKFMKAVVEDRDYILSFPCESREQFDSGVVMNKVDYNILTQGAIGYYKKIRAREYWDEIIKSAHSVAEPGLMFWDTMTNYSPDSVYEQFKQITTNPCSEIAMQSYDACRLIAHNLYHYVKKPFTKEAFFDYKQFYINNYEAMRLSDDLVDLELEAIDRILLKIESDKEDIETKRRERLLWEKVRNTAKASRRTGLGFTGLGDTLAALGMKYDSKESFEEVEDIMEVKMRSELDCTIDMSIERGSFEGWDSEKEFPTRFADTYGESANDFYGFIEENYWEECMRMEKHGRRNVSWSTVAPTGSVSLLAQVTSGIEPLFKPYYTRRKKINPEDKGSRVDFTDPSGDKWQEFNVLHPRFKDYLEHIGFIDVDEMSKSELKECFEVSPWFGSTAEEIDWVRRVELQGLIQQYISHSISSTINLPTEVEESVVSQIYIEAWKKGLKGITVYRDGSRTGVLVTEEQEKFIYRDAPKRPKELECEIYHTVVRGDMFVVVVGLFHEKPYEVFAFNPLSDKEIIPKGKGILVKKARGKYEYQNGQIWGNLPEYMNNEQETVTRLISTSLRHGADIKFIVEQLNKTHGDMFSFTKAISRIVKRYIPNGAKSTLRCTNKECRSYNVIFEEGCSKCMDCGNSKCG